MLKWHRDYNITDWLYQINENDTARYILGIDGTNPLVCFGINPSTARPQYPDPTLKRVEKRAWNDNFDGWIMFNVYPQRATEPKNLHEDVNKELHNQNLHWIEKILSRGNLMVWSAWGNTIDLRHYLLPCLRDIDKIVQKTKCQWVSLGLTAQGNPVHPLYRAKGFELYKKSFQSLKLFIK